MFSPISSECSNILTDGFIATLQDSPLTQNPYLRAAEIRYDELRMKAVNDFVNTQHYLDTSKPVFNSAAYPRIHKMDKITGKGKEGQALFDKPGQHYGGENATVGLIRKRRAQIRTAESQTYKIIF